MKLFAFLLLIFTNFGPQATPEGIKFTYYDPNAREVYLAGDFNNWDTRALPMKKDSNGVFYVIVKLSPGRHEYKFVVDGKWTADPENPVKAGPYGNSVIQVDENGNLVPIMPLSNTPLSSMVYIHGEIKAFLPFKKDTLENKLRLIQSEEDFKLDITATLKSVKLWSRLRYNTLQNMDTLTKMIPVRIEKATLKMGNNPQIFTFYNKRFFESDEPFKLIGFQGKHYEKFGHGEQGITFKIQKKPFRELLLLYSNEINTDRDIGFFRSKIPVKGFDFGFSFRVIDAFNREYQVPSPDSLRVPGDTALLHFNLFDRDFFWAFDFSKKLPGNLQIKIGAGAGRRYVVAGENDVNGQRTLWVRDNRKWLKFKKKRIFAGLFYKTKGFYWAQGMDFERIDYSRLFLKEKEGDIKFLRAFWETEKKGQRYNFGIRASFTNIMMKDSVPWSYFFDYSWYSRLKYYEWPLCGYPTKITVEPRFEFQPSEKLKLNFYAESHIAMASFNLLPFSIEEIEGIKWRKGKFLFNYELRTYRLKSEFLESDFILNDHYAEIAYYITPHALLRISYGLRPYDLDNHYWARDEFLEEHGASEYLLRSGFTRLGKIMEKAERALSKVNQITIWGELSF